MDNNDNLVVTISREAGSGGRTVGRILAAKLGVRYSDKDLIKALREKFNLTTSAIEELKTRKNSWITNFLQMVAPVPDVREQLGVNNFYTLNLRPDVSGKDIFNAECEILKGIAAEGPCVIAGRSAFFILKDCTDKVDVFITSSREKRVKRMLSRQNLSVTEAETVIDSLDRSREQFVKQYAGVSRYDLRNYDLVINMDEISEEDAAEIILKYLKDRK